MTDDHTTTPEQATTEPGLRRRLEAVLPPWTHWGGGLFGPTTATWTTPAGKWSVSFGALGSPWPTLTGPGGTWAFGKRNADHVIGVLRALDAIEADSQPGRYCDALCRDVEEDRDQLAAVAERRHAAGYAEAVARLRDDERYTDWWMSGDAEPTGLVRQHLADYLEAVGPDGIDVTTGEPQSVEPA